MTSRYEKNLYGSVELVTIRAIDHFSPHKQLIHVMNTPSISTSLIRVLLPVIVLAVSSLLGGGQAFGQVNGPGTSDSGLFDNVINVPADLNRISGSIGGDGLTTQLNLEDGGAIDFNFDANSGSEVNINGGLANFCLLYTSPSPRDRG